MIYFLYGSDNKKAREKAHEIEASLLKKKPDAALFRVTTENWDENWLTDLIEGQGLFTPKYIVILDRLFENKEIKEYVVKNLKEIQGSEHVFIFIEGEMDKTTLGKIEKKSEKIQEFDDSRPFPKKEDKKFNVFSLTDALAARDKKKLWILFQEAKRKGSVAEEIHGILWFQIKAMMLADEGKSATDTGLNPFVFNKSKSAAKNFKPHELEDMASNFIKMYHDSHRGLHDFDIELEKFILEL